MKTTIKILAWLSLTLILGGCGLAQNPEAPAPEPDTTAPEITAFTPAQGATLEPAQIRISVSFSEAVDPATLDGNLSVTRDGGQALAGTWTYDPATFTARFEPADPYPLNALITVTVSPGITDLAGNPLAAGKTWSFRTPRTYTLKIRTSGLVSGTTVTVLESGSGQRLALSANTTQAFPQPYLEGSTVSLSLEQVDLPPDSDLACALERLQAVLSADLTVRLYCSPVVPLYPAHGARWNDYLANDGADPLSAGDQACTPSALDACLHGGEMRRYRLPAGVAADCTDITAADDLGAFRWACRVNGDGQVEVASLGLTEGKGLRDLIDFQRTAWRVNQVRVFKGGSQIAASGEGIWWPNPVLAPDQTLLDRSGAVYAVGTASPVRKFRIYDKAGIALVTAPGLVLTTSGTDEVFLAQNSSRLWLELSVDGAGRAAYGIHLDNDLLVNLVNSTVAQAGGHGIRISNPSYAPLAVHRLRRVESHDNGGDGIRIKAKQVDLAQVAGYANAGNGITLSLAEEISLTAVKAAGNAGHGLRLDRSHRNRIRHLAAYANGGDGLRLETARDNLVQDLLAAANGGDGLRLTAWDGAPSSHNLLRQITAGGNGGRGLALEQAEANRIGGLAAAGNGGDGLDPGAGGDALAESVVDTCTGACPAGVETGLDLSAFVGPVTVDDAGNADDIDGQRYANQIHDWTTFANDYRIWARAGGAGRCGGAELCQVTDWSLSASDTTLLGRLAVPTGDDTLTHTWSDGTTSTALVHALEEGGDGLCESQERCLYTPNIGAYPGHGQRQTLPFTDGAISGVTLEAYQENGR